MPDPSRALTIAALVGSVVALSACESAPPPAGPTTRAAADPGSASPTMLAETRPGDVLLASEAWTFGDRTGQMLQSLSYRIYTTSQRQTLVDRLPLFMELALEHYTTALGDLPKPREPLETYLLGTRPQWEAMTRKQMGENAGLYLQIQRGGFTSGGVAVLYEIGPRDTYTIAAHEGWHQFTQKTFRSALPVAFEEGLATYMEGFRWDSTNGRPNFMPWANSERFDQLRSAQREGKLMPLHELIRRSPQELIGQGDDAALVFYAQVWAMIHFLHEGEGGRYHGALQDLLLDASKGRVVDRVRASYGGRAASLYASRRQGVDLLELYTSRPAEDLDVEYQAFITKIVRVGAKQLIVQGQSPAQ